MSDVAELSVIFKGKEVGLKSLITSIEAALKKADAATEKSASDTEKLAQTQQRAANEALGLASAYARLDTATGNSAGAAARLRVALEQNTAAGEKQNVAIQTQIARLEQQKVAATSTSSAISQLAGAAGSLGIAFGAQQIIQGAVALTQTGAQALQTAQRFDQLASSAGQSGTAILAALRSASGGQISDLNLQLAANRANLLGVATSADQLATLMSIARDRAQSLGTTATEAFNDLVTGLGRGSPLILDNLGIMVDIKGANEAYAASVGKTVAQLSEEEKKMALINQVVADGKAKLLETGGAADTAAGSFAALGVAAENAGAKLGSTLATALTPASQGATALLNMATTGENLNQTISQLVGALAQFESAGLSSGDAAASATSQFLTFLGVTNEAPPVLTAATSGGKAWGEALFSSGAAAAAAAGATRGMVTETSAATAAISGQLTASIDAEAKTRALAEAQDLIARLGGAVAAGFGTSASAAAAYAVQLGITTAQAELLIAAQARIADGKARLAGQAAQTRDNSGSIGFNAPGRGKGSDADILATINKTQAEMTRKEAEGQTKRTTVARSGGAARVSTEQKTAQQIESQEQSHQAKLVKIAQDGAAKRAEAEQSLKQAQLSGRAAFYASLASIDDQSLRQDLSARYESAAQAAAEIAKTQGADAAEAYLAASQQQIEGEAQIQGQINEARSAGNEGQAAYLEGVLALQKAANENELKNITEKGSAIAAQQAAQYAEEEAQYAAHLDKMIATYNTKVGANAGTAGLPPPGLGGTGGASPSVPVASKPATSTASPGTPQPVIDVATPAAVDQQTGQLGGKLDAVNGKLDALIGAIGGVKSAIDGLKRSGATASG